jgi:hypothetical protein
MSPFHKESAQREKKTMRTSNTRPHKKDLAKVPSVCETARERADEEEEKDLDGPDPGDVAGRFVESRCVVGLKNAEGVYKAPEWNPVSQHLMIHRS